MESNGDYVATPREGVVVPRGITIPGNLPFARDYGAVFQAQLNRVKTTAKDFARQSELPEDYLNSVLRGENAPNAALLIAIEKTSPLSVRELIDPRYAIRVPILDDSVDGVVICQADESASKKRVYHRGDDVKYYTYFHTAVQKKSSIIPEKIVEHHEHDPNDPNLPDEYFNNGHRERQMSVTIGTVNYHWIDADGKKHVVETHTGDANAINPFTRHSFTVPPGEEGYILAVTDLGAIGMPDFRALTHALDKREYLNLMRRMLPADAPLSSFDELCGFMFRRYDVATSLSYTDGANMQRILMDDITAHPSFVASEFSLPPTPFCGEYLDILENANIWGYVLEGVLELFWSGHTKVIGVDDSYSIQKDIPHRLRGLAGLGGKVIVMQSNPNEESELEQLALVHKFRGDEGLLRAASESEVWFKEAKKR